MNFLIKLLLLCVFLHKCLANGSTDPCANPQNLNVVIDFREAEDHYQNLIFNGPINQTDHSGCLTLEISALAFNQLTRPRFAQIILVIDLAGRLFNTCSADPSPLSVTVFSQQNVTILNINPDDQTTIVSPFSATGNLSIPTNSSTVSQFKFATKNNYVFLPGAEPNIQDQNDMIEGNYFVEPTCVTRLRTTKTQRVVYSPLFEFSFEISNGSTYYFDIPQQTPFQASFTQSKFFWEHCTCNIQN